jgi:hypothetical protein
MASNDLCADLTPLTEFTDYQLMCIDSHSRCQIQAIALPVPSNFGGVSTSHTCLAIRRDGRITVHATGIGAPRDWHLYNRSPVR